MKLSLSEIRKFVVAVLGVAASALSLGLLHGTVGTVVTAVIAVASVAGVYVVPNAPTPKAS